MRFRRAVQRVWKRKRQNEAENVKKRRLEFLFLYFMIFGAYVVFWWPVPAWGFQLYAASYIAIILFSIISLMLENRTSQHTLLWMYVLIFSRSSAICFICSRGSFMSKDICLNQRECITEKNYAEYQSLRVSRMRRV